MNAVASTLLAQAANPNAGYELTGSGWFFMLTSVSSVTLVLVWCLWRVVRETPGKVRSPVDIEPPDERADREGR